MRLFLLITVITLALLGLSTTVEYIKADNQQVYRDDVSIYTLTTRDSTFYSKYSLETNLTRKTAHFMVYGAITYIIFTFSTGKLLGRATLAFASASFIGALDELHQHFLLDRSGRLLDVIVNSAGSLSAAILLVALCLVNSK